MSSVGVAPTVAPRVAEHVRRVVVQPVVPNEGHVGSGGGGGGRVVGWLVGPSSPRLYSTAHPSASSGPHGAVSIVGTLCCGEAAKDEAAAESPDSEFSGLLADLRRASALLPGGLAVVGAYTTAPSEEAGEGAAWTLVSAIERQCGRMGEWRGAALAETRGALDRGAFVVATVVASVRGEIIGGDNGGGGTATTSYFMCGGSESVGTERDCGDDGHRRVGSVISVEATELEDGWLDTEYVLLRCGIKVPIGGDGGHSPTANAAAALAAAAAETASAALVFVLDLRVAGARGTGGGEEQQESGGGKSGGGGGGGSGKKGGKKGGKGSSGKGSGSGSGGGGDGEVASKPAEKVLLGGGGSGDDALIGSLLPHRSGAHVVCVTALVRTSPDGESESSSPSSLLPAPAFEYTAIDGPDGAPAPFRIGGAAPPAEFAYVDALAYTPRTTATFATAAAALRSALAAQCKSLAACAAEAAENVKGDSSGGQGVKPLEPRSLHFLPQGVGHAVTVTYPLPPGELRASNAVEPDAGLESVRMALHWTLCLPLDRPMLRVANALGAAADARFGGDTSGGGGGGGRLRNVHTMGLPKSHVEGGTAHCVQGGYDYFHYMQDRFDDNGWGCAYRSLQTLSSWFSIQNYTAVPIPSHRDIQSCLVKMGDKPASFLGSKQWIGAIELSYILDELMGLTCKIMTVQSGHDLPSKGRELARHFDTTGTPIMMGGGGAIVWYPTRPVPEPLYA